MEKTIIISATTDWKLEDILNCLIRGNGWKGFHAGIGSKDGKVRVTITVERHLSDQSNGPDKAETKSKVDKNICLKIFNKALRS